jgi:hypothetical protein
MEELPESPAHLIPYNQEQAIIEETAAQLQKDFGEFSFSIVFTGKHETPYRELFDQVLPIVELMLRNEPSMMNAMLYRIDVSEGMIKKFSFSNPGIPFPSLLTDLILRREMQKVLTRRYFKEKKGCQ